MEALTSQERAAVLLEQLKPEFLKLLSNCPHYGAVGIDLVIHDGEITRIVSRVELSRKPRTGRAL